MNTFIKGLVSIAIPAYKATYLKEAIESVLSQTYTNFELIIVNDKSPEDIDSIVQCFKDSRIRYYKNKINLGKKSIVHNWNKCLSYAKGEFFVLLCDDDVMKPQFLSTMLRYASKYKQCNVFRSRCIVVKNEISNTIKESPIWEEYQDEGEFINNKFRGIRQHTISEFLHRTSHIKTIKYTPYPVGYYSDDASILKLVKNSGIVSTIETLIYFRKSNEHISGNYKYNIQKAQAALYYYKWLHTTYSTEIIPYKQEIKNRMEFELCNYFLQTTHLIKALYILYIIPKEIYNPIQKCAILFSKLKNCH